MLLGHGGISKLNAVFHHLPSVGHKQLCALASLGCNCTDRGYFLVFTSIMGTFFRKAFWLHMHLVANCWDYMFKYYPEFSNLHYRQLHTCRLGIFQSAQNETRPNMLFTPNLPAKTTYRKILFDTVKLRDDCNCICNSNATINANQC